jgi:hypothetical protein
MPPGFCRPARHEAGARLRARLNNRDWRREAARTRRRDACATVGWRTQNRIFRHALSRNHAIGFNAKAPRRKDAKEKGENGSQINAHRLVARIGKVNLSFAVQLFKVIHLEKICQGNDGPGNKGKALSFFHSPDHHSPDHGFFSLHALSKSRQRNNLRLCRFPIPLPNIPLPILPFFGCGRAGPLRLSAFALNPNCMVTAKKHSTRLAGLAHLVTVSLSGGKWLI